jgi:hypothetical protein
VNKRLIYEKIDSGERVEFYKIGGHYFDDNHKLVHAKEMRVLWKFVGYLVRDDLRKPVSRTREKFTVRRLQCDTTVNINGFKLRKYKMKTVEI